MEKVIKGKKQRSSVRKTRGFYNYEEGRKVSVSKEEYKIPSSLRRALDNYKF